MSLEIKPSIPSGTVAAPPSKSCTHRLLLGAALAGGESIIRALAYSEDILATIGCVMALGAECKRSGNAVAIRGFANKRSSVFSCGESGSTLRFFVPVAMTVNDEAVFTGSRRLMARGVGVYEDVFRDNGLAFIKQGESFIAKGAVEAGDYVIPGDVSSQFVTGLMFALPRLAENSTVRVLPPVESRAYIMLTVQILKSFGVEISEPEDNLFFIKGGQNYRPVDATVEGDWSNAAVLLALNELGGSVTVTGLDESSLQGDRCCIDMFAALREKDAVLDISGCPDLGPVLFAVAAAKNGGTFTGTKRLRIKESDRAAAMAQELGKFGVRVDVGDNTVVVAGGGIKKPSQTLWGHNDHRIVMALAALACMTGGSIHGSAAVRKSYPDFFSVLERLGVELRDDD